ncbi:MAG: HupE/UreJ family protein [Luteimonas sp.]
MTMRIVQLGLLVLAILCAAIAPAVAHTLSVSHLDVQVDDAGDARVELDLALRDLALTLPIDANRDEAITWGELQAQRDAIETLVLSKVTLMRLSSTCRLTPTGLATRRYDDGMYAVLQLAARCPLTGTLRIDYRLLFDRDPQHRALITVRQAGKVSSGIARAEATVVEARLEGGNPFVDFVREGIHHILLGYDHLAFLISLLLPAALVRTARRWQPSPGLRSSFLHILGIVTAFTVAHSVTLSLAALGWITPASRWVEAAIAASVLLAALNNLWPVVTRRVWVVGFLFGLIHGFGFAGALAELGLPRQSRLLALFGFNLGVELGQLGVVVLLLPLLFAVRGQRWYARMAMPLLSIAIAALAAWWLVQRLAG